MPHINSHQSYALDKPKGRLNPVTHYINQPTHKTRPADIANAYSLHMERVAMQQKRDALVKKGEPWRNNLEVLRTKPRPHELELLKHPGGKSKKKSVKTIGTSEGNVTQRSKFGNNNNDILVDISRKGKQVLKMSTARNNEQQFNSNNKLKHSADFNSSEAIETLGLIMDPGVSTEERYEKYIREIEHEDDDYSELQATYRPTKTERGFKLMLAKEGYVTTDDDEDTVFDDKFVKNLAKDDVVVLSRGPSKAPSRIGRVSSLGLDGRMSVTGAHINEKKDSLSRLSMNSVTDGRGYVYRDGEIQRKLFLSSSRENGASSSRCSGVDQNVKLMEILTKNTKVIPVYDESNKTVLVKKKFKKGGKKVSSAKDEDKLEGVSEVKGGGFKVVHGGKSKRQPDFDKMIPVSVVSKSCEIQTQTEVITDSETTVT